MLKKSFFLFAVCIFTATAFADDNNDLGLIPQPQKFQRQDGTFTLTSKTRIYSDHSSRTTAKFFADRLRQSTGYPLKIHSKPIFSAPSTDAILFTTKDANTNLGPEGYELTVGANGVIVRAPTQTGLFYGGETLMQLLPTEIFSTNIVTRDWTVPYVQIQDWPRFPWRGLMLDVSRHFYNKDEVKAVVDEMALYKLNYFHWHLVDDDGWRLQVKQYPKLTETSAWRQHVDLARNHPGATRAGGENAQFDWTKPTADKFAPDGRYGGFYTPDDIREVVAYAAARHITVVPEIEMPGHEGSVLAAYPELSVTKTPYEVERPGPFHVGVMDPANPDTYVFLETVLDEVFKLFPGPYVHIGGDEVPNGALRKSPACIALMQKEGFTNEFQLQSYLNERIEKYVNAHGKTLIGWSEILKGGLSPNAVVMDWIGGGKKAAEAGHDAVMSLADPIDYCYLDHYQSTNHLTEPRGIGGYLPLSRVYAFEPIPAGLPENLQHHILGPQGNLWCEYVASLPHAQYMIFPRACAMAEVGWSAKDARNWDDFQERLAVDEKRLNELNVNYRHGTSEPMFEQK
jgi:hexosaminidase